MQISTSRTRKADRRNCRRFSHCCALQTLHRAKVAVYIRGIEKEASAQTSLSRLARLSSRHLNYLVMHKCKPDSNYQLFVSHCELVVRYIDSGRICSSAQCKFFSITK